MPPHLDRRRRPRCSGPVHTPTAVYRPRPRHAGSRSRRAPLVAERQLYRSRQRVVGAGRWTMVRAVYLRARDKEEGRAHRRFVRTRRPRASMTCSTSPRRSACGRIGSECDLYGSARPFADSSDAGCPRGSFRRSWGQWHAVSRVGGLER